MQTIKNNISHEIIIKNSKFICHLYKVDNTNVIDNILSSLKKTYKDATHYCYAYMIDNIKKADDDGEPSGTAGLPILNVLENNNLNYILAVVIRYFGGIKLGAGGLVRAYTKSVTNTITKENIIELIKGYNIEIEFEYNQTKEIDYLLKNIKINNKEYNKTIKYNLNIPIQFTEILDQNKIKYNIIKNIYLEKE